MKQTKPLMIRRMAGERTQGAGSLYCYSYSDLAELLGCEPIDVAKAAAAGELDPLSLPELALARQHGLGWLRRQLSSEDAVAKTIIDSRPLATVEVAVANPPQREAPPGLDTLWAITYACVATQVGQPVPSVRQAGKGERRTLDIRSLASVLDYVAARHPLLVAAA